MQNIRQLIHFLKKFWLFHKCCFFGQYGRKFRQLLLPRSKMDPKNFTFWALNRPFLGKKLANFFPGQLLTHFITKKIFRSGDLFWTKKYLIFSKNKILKEFIAKNHLEYSKKAIFHFYAKNPKINFGGKFFPKWVYWL